MKDKKLLQYASKSGLMEISISYGKEEFSFNLNDELTIDENKINHEAQVQPSAYAFLNMLYKKLLRAYKEAERKAEKKHAHLWLQYKKDKDPESGRAMNNDSVRAMIIKNPDYQELLVAALDAEQQANIIEVCVKSFEQRSNLIQTLSANLRKEK